MLRTDDRPPDFTLPDRADGGQLALADLIGEKWILIILAPSESGARAAAVFLADAASRHACLDKSDLHIIAIFARGSWVSAPQANGPIHILVDANGQTAKQYDSNFEGASFYLIGKDGRIELATPEAPSLDELVRLIDGASEALPQTPGASYAGAV